MGLLTTLASLLGIELDLLAKKAKENAIAFGIIGVFAAIGVVFLLVALYNWAWMELGPIEGPLAVAGGAFVIAIIAFVVVRIQQAALKRRAAARRQAAQSRAVATSAAIALLPELLASPTVRNVGLPVALYAAALLFLPPKGDRPRSPDRE